MSRTSARRVGKVLVDTLIGKGGGLGDNRVHDGPNFVPHNLCPGRPPGLPFAPVGISPALSARPRATRRRPGHRRPAATWRREVSNARQTLAPIVNAIHMAYIIGMETAYPVRKALQFTAEQWEQVRAFRFDAKIDTEAEAVRRLIEFGLQAAKIEPAQH